MSTTTQAPTPLFCAEGHEVQPEGKGRYICKTCNVDLNCGNPEKCEFHRMPGPKHVTEDKCWCGQDLDVRVEVLKSKAGQVEMMIIECTKPGHYHKKEPVEKSK